MNPLTWFRRKIDEERTAIADWPKQPDTDGHASKTGVLVQHTSKSRAERAEVRVEPRWAVFGK